jgi:hypothetical protein
MNTSELMTAIDAWTAKGKQWAEEGHTLALSILAHHTETGDIGPVNRLLTTMPKGTKRNAMAEWFLAFGKLSVTDDKSRPMKHDKTKEAKLEDAKATPWYEFQPEKEIVEVFDLQAALKSLLARAGKATKVSDPELFKALEAAKAAAEEAAQKAAESTQPETTGDPLAAISDPATQPA